MSYAFARRSAHLDDEIKVYIAEKLTHVPSKRDISITRATGSHLVGFLIVLGLDDFP